MGLRLVADAAPQSLGIWLENVHAFNVYWHLGDQWRMGGMGGVVGMDMTMLPFFLELEKVPRSDWLQVTTDVRAMAAEAMRLMRGKAEQ